MGKVHATVWLGVLWLALLSSCGRIQEGKRTIKVTKCAEARFAEQAKAWESGPTEPGEQAYRVFARSSGEDYPTGRMVEATKMSDQPLVYQVKIPFCYEREAADGRTENRQAEFQVRVEIPEGGEAEAKVAWQQVTNDAALSGGDQVQSWMRNAGLVFAMLWFITLGWKDSLWAGIVGLGAIVWVGVTSYYCFNAWWAVPLGVLVFAVLGGIAGGLLLGVWAALTKTGRSPG